MCTNPVTITRNYPSIGSRSYVVPCGKCEECVKKKQAEFGALSLHQALSSGSLHFVTFTYSDATLPMAMSEVCDDSPRVVGFSRGLSDDMKSRFYKYTSVGPMFSNTLFSSTDGIYYAASLCREDIKLVLKLFRQRCKQRFGSSPDFKYAVFGELGEERGRPHYHGLFFGLSGPHVALLCDIWRERFGFVYCVPDQFNRQLSLVEIQKVTAYTSKYISKGVASRWSWLLPYVEKPRRQSSINFGGFTDEELSALCDFIFVAIYLMEDVLTLSSWIVSYLDGNLLKSQVNHFRSHNV